MTVSRQPRPRECPPRRGPAPRPQHHGPALGRWLAVERKDAGPVRPAIAAEAVPVFAAGLAQVLAEGANLAAAIAKLARLAARIGRAGAAAGFSGAGGLHALASLRSHAGGAGDSAILSRGTLLRQGQLASRVSSELRLASARARVRPTKDAGQARFTQSTKTAERAGFVLTRRVDGVAVLAGTHALRVVRVYTDTRE